ncbi:MAG: hypothetical protein NW223_07385 [Hyphomicrobiaceae bacterium]|nr:hypothetical protein [Hyphomicrobiaceae bacterium]
MLYTLADSAGIVLRSRAPRSSARLRASWCDLTRAVAAVPAWQLGALGGLVALQTIQIVMHQPWSDEYQAWLIALASSPATLLHNLRNEGHPLLWYVILMAVQTVTSDPAALKMVQWVAAAATTGLIIVRAPFAPWLRIAIALNYYCFFEYSAIGRSYSAGVLLWALALATWRHWSVWLWLGLMLHVSAHFQWLAGLLVLYRWATVGSNWPALLGIAAAWLLAVASMWPATDTVAAAKPAGILFAVVSIGAIVSPITAFGGWFGWTWPPALLMLCNVAALGVMLYAVSCLFPRDFVRTGLVAIMLALVLAFCALVYPCYPRHFGVAALLIVALAWLGGLATRRARAIFAAMVTLWAVQGLAAFALSSTQPAFSAATEAAQWIVRQGLSERRWAADAGLADTSFAAVTGRRVYSLEQDCLLRFHRWNRKDRPLAPAVANARLARAAAGDDRILVMTETRLKFKRFAERQLQPQTDLDWIGIEKDQARELAAFGPDRQAKIVRLYEITPRAVGTAPPPEVCD